MRNDHGSGDGSSSNITPEMRNLFLSLGVKMLDCERCKRNTYIELMEWNNVGMWFICSDCLAKETGNP